MPRNDDTTRILVPRAAADRIAQALSRRRFLGLAAGAAAGTALLAACGGGGDSSSGGGGGGKINLYTWAEYDDPDLINGWGSITTDIYDSNEEAIQKLSAAKGTSGYDIVVPTGAYIPQMVLERPPGAARPEQDPELQEPRRPVHEPAVGPGQQVHASARTGAPRVGSTTTP